MAGTITDITAVEPAFVTERFELAGDRLEISGQWSGLRGRRLMRPVLWLHHGEGRRRLVAVLDHKPWAVDDDDPWLAAFPWPGGPLEAERAELEVGRELVVELPVPGAEAADAPRPARARRPTEVERLRAELAAARAELRDRADSGSAEAAQLRAQLTAARAAESTERERLSAELAAAREDAQRARADGERMVNDEYEQRRRAIEAAEAAAARARKAQAAHDLTRRQLTAARESYAKLEQRLAAAEPKPDPGLQAQLTATIAERDDLAKRLAAAEAERDRLGRQLEAARDERDRAREQLAAAPARVAEVESERDRLRKRLAAAEEQREHVRARLAAAEVERDGLRNEVVAAAGPPVRRPLAEPASPIGPPQSGPGLWVVRALALALVAVLLAAAGLVLAGVL
jgi:hypothetical protein